MESPLARFFADCLEPTSFCIIGDNARAHQNQRTSTTNVSQKQRRKPCRWDSSLSGKDCLLQNLNVPKRPSDRCTTETETPITFPVLFDAVLLSPEDPGESKQEYEDNDDDSESFEMTSFTSSSVSNFEVCFWAHKSFPPGSPPNKKVGPPKMPQRGTESCYPAGTTMMKEMEELSSVC